MPIFSGRAFGAEIFHDPAAAFAKVLEALQAFQLEDDSFHPYSSKFDLYASNKIGGTLTPSEQRGFRVFMSETKGNCVACHYNGPGFAGSVRMFTDYSYEAIGVPRNDDIPGNRNAKVLRSGSLRAVGSSASGQQRVLRHVQDAHAEKRRDQAGVLSQRPDQNAARRDPFLQYARHEPRGVGTQP